MLAYMNEEAYTKTLETKKATISAEAEINCG